MGQRLHETGRKAVANKINSYPNQYLLPLNTIFDTLRVCRPERIKIGTRSILLYLNMEISPPGKCPYCHNSVINPWQTPLPSNFPDYESLFQRKTGALQPIRMDIALFKSTGRPLQ